MRWSRPQGAWVPHLSTYYYAWRNGDWYAVIAVPAAMAEPAALRDAIRDKLFAAFIR